MSPTPGSTPTRVRYSILGFTLALTAISYLDRVRISMTAPAIKAELGLTDTQMGYVFSAFMLSYALCEIPAGWMASPARISEPNLGNLAVSQVGGHQISIADQTPKPPV